MKKLALALLVAGTLTACGGGGSKPAPEHNHGGSNAGSHTNNANANAGANHAGNAGSANAGNQANTQASKVDVAQIIDVVQLTNTRNLSDYSMNHIVVDGKRFDIRARSEAVPVLIAFPYVKMGYVEAGFREGSAFLIGEKTKDMPAAGVAHYVGNGVFVDDDNPNKENDGDLIHAQVRLVADFANKQLKGKFIAEKGSLDVDAQINAQQASFKGATVSGNFFGPQADNLAGTYQDGPIAGFFGAKKQ